MTRFEILKYIKKLFVLFNAYLNKYQRYVFYLRFKNNIMN